MQMRYSVQGPSTAGTGPVTAVTIIAASTVRPMIYEFCVGVSTTPADQTYQACISRATTTGTAGSNPTPTPLDGADRAALSTAGITHSAEPGSPTDLYMIYLNQRSSYRWVCQDGSELVCPATASNNIGARMKTASASSTMQATVLFRE